MLGRHTVGRDLVIARDLGEANRENNPVSERRLMMMKWLGLGGCVLGLLLAGYLALGPTGTQRTDRTRPFEYGETHALPSEYPHIGDVDRESGIAVRDPAIARIGLAAFFYFAVTALMIWLGWRSAVIVASSLGLVFSLVSLASVGMLLMLPTMMILLASALGPGRPPRQATKR